MNNMNAQQLLRKAILLKAVEFENIEPFREKLNGQEIDELYDGYNEYDELADPISEIRCSGIETNLRPMTSSRHYEVDSVAMNIDGFWVEWPYLYGGGKHGEPESYDWIGAARIVNCEEKEVLTIQHIFSEVN